jgi:hypothetical protein
MLKIYLGSLSIMGGFLLAAPVHANTISEWMASDAAYAWRSPSYTAAQARAASATMVVNVETKAALINAAGTFTHDSVMIARPVATSLNVPFVAKSVSGTAGKVLLRRGLAFAGPVALGVTVAMTAYDLYELTRLDAAGYPELNKRAKNQLNAALGIAPPGTNTDFSSMQVGSFASYNGTGYKLMTTSFTPGYCSYGNTACIDHDINYMTEANYFIDVNGRDATQYNFEPWTLPAPVYGTASPEIFADAITSPTTGELYPLYQPELDKAMKANLSPSTPTATNPSGEPLAVVSPSTAQIKDVANRVATADAAATSVATAQANYTANPTAENLQTLNDAKLKESQVQQKNDQAESLTAPSLPVVAFDATVTPPVKKEIPTLLSTTVASSPLVSMVQSFGVTTSEGSPVVPIGMVYGNDMSFDFSRYSGTFSALGGVLLAIMHGFAIFVVVRGW